MWTSPALSIFAWMNRLVPATFPLTLSLSHKGRGDPRTTSSYKSSRIPTDPYAALFPAT
jgi:hypothetical protein